MNTLSNELEAMKTTIHLLNNGLTIKEMVMTTTIINFNLPLTGIVKSSERHLMTGLG